MEYTRQREQSVNVEHGVLLRPSGDTWQCAMISQKRLEIKTFWVKLGNIDLSLVFFLLPSSLWMTEHSFAWLLFFHSAHIIVFLAVRQSAQGPTLSCCSEPEGITIKVAMSTGSNVRLSFVRGVFLTYSAAFTEAVCHFRMQVRYIERGRNFAGEY